MMRSCRIDTKLVFVSLNNCAYSIYLYILDFHTNLWRHYGYLGVSHRGPWPNPQTPLTFEKPPQKDRVNKKFSTELDLEGPN